MKSWKFKIGLLVALVTILIATKYILFNYVVSTGKRVGNLTKISNKGRILKTWEGTIDEGYGEALTTYVSVKDNKLAKEMYGFKGKAVVLYYEEHILCFPRDTKYNVVKWEAQGGDEVIRVETSPPVLDPVDGLETAAMAIELYTGMLCSIKENNLFLYKQYDKCNE